MKLKCFEQQQVGMAQGSSISSTLPLGLIESPLHKNKSLTRIFCLTKNVKLTSFQATHHFATALSTKITYMDLPFVQLHCVPQTTGWQHSMLCASQQHLKQLSFPITQSLQLHIQAQAPPALTLSPICRQIAGAEEGWSYT